MAASAKSGKAKKKDTAEDLSKFKIKDYVFRVKDAEPGDFISYDASLCTGCGECAMVCSVSLWTLPKNAKKARLSKKYKELCLECAACYAVCEADAVDFRYPDGGSGIIIKHG